MEIESHQLSTQLTEAAISVLDSLKKMLILISLLQSINSPRNKETKTSRNYDNNNTFLSECPESHIRATEYTKDL
jgi:hypothetical protein